eukprot:m.111967 g.111967  ORF g.111967 m.111967 type:complete len:273 (+) comp12773_c1_seq1:121-939(+)
MSFEEKVVVEATTCVGADRSNAYQVSVSDVRLSSKTILDVIGTVKRKLESLGVGMNDVVAVSFERNDLKTVEDVGEMVRLFQYIERVSVTRNNLNGEGVEQLCRVLETRAHLHTLDLSHNRLTDVVAGAIQRLLCSSDQKITHLLLRDNNLTADTGMALSKALMDEEHCVLEELNIGVNDLSDSGCIAIGTALQSNNTLKQLNMDTNIITLVGLKSLVDALHDNNTLVFLSMRHNKLGEDGVKMMDELMESNKTLTDVHLRGNKSTLAHTSI